MNADFGKIDRILVRAVNWVGDTILTYPAVQRLKRHFPRSHVAILVRDNLVDLWKTFPDVDELIPFRQKRGGDGLREDVRLGLFLKKKRFDLAAIFPRSFRSAYQIYLARIPIRLGYEGEWRSLFLTHGIRQTEEVVHGHRIHYYQRLMDVFGIGEKMNAPRIFLRDEDRNWAQERLKELGLLNGRLLIGMNPGATYGLAKCWYPDRFGEAGKRLVQKRKASILLFGKAEERPVTQGILHYFKEDGVDFTGETGLLQLAAILERCQLLVTNDTGTMHVAAAVGTPVVALFGPTDSVTTGPWGERHQIVKKEVPCAPCLKRICPTDHQCMKRITVDEVEEVIDHRLRSLGR
jgi:heptosyltransferase II